MTTSQTFIQQGPLGTVQVAVTRHPVEADKAFHVPYEGLDPAVQAEFPDGFLPAYGSGLAFKGLTDDGTLEFFCLTDRGPNGDGPQVALSGEKDTKESKIFPAPSFIPSIGVIRVANGRAELVSSIPILDAPGVPMSGLPIHAGGRRSSSEVPVDDALRSGEAGTAGFSPAGIDSEAIACDRKRNVVWVADEYGPFLAKVDTSTGLMLERYGPGTGLPEVLALRRANRGMEGMTLDPDTGHIHAFLQSPLSDGKALHAKSGKKEKIERFAAFLRWVEFDPDTGTTLRMMAYPLDASDFADSRTGNAKLGDIAAIGEGRFIVIEQGESASGGRFNKLMLVDTRLATNIADEVFQPISSDLEKSSMAGRAVNGARWADVIALVKTELLDLNAIGWVAEKAEGLALVDEQTLAITNDNDFGLKARVFDQHGRAVKDAAAEDFVVDANGEAISGGKPGQRIRIAQGSDEERPLTLWLVRFDQPLALYAPV